MTVVSNYEYYIDTNVSLIHVGISTNEILPNQQNLDFVIKCKTKFCRIGRISKYWDMMASIIHPSLDGIIPWHHLMALII